jgi:2'-5' RNA ligase
MGQLEQLFFQIEAQEAVGSLGPRVSRLGEQILIVPVGGLSVLAEQVRAATAPQGSSDQLPFVGHITLGRMKETGSAELEGTAIEGAFRVDQLLLVESRIDSGGHAHTVVGSQPLLQ